MILCFRNSPCGGTYNADDYAYRPFLYSKSYFQRGKGFILGRCPLTPPFEYILTDCPDRPNLSWRITQRFRRVSPDYNDMQIRLRPRIYSSGITKRPVPLSRLPHPKTVRPHGRLDGISSLSQSLPSPLRRLSHIDVMHASGIVRLHSHFTTKLTNPIRNTNLSDFSSTFDILIQLHATGSN